MEKMIQENEGIKKMSSKRRKPLESLSQTEVDRIEGLMNAIESMGLQEFMEYIRSPWKMLWPNFLAGIARGIGALLGVAVVLTVIGWVFAVTIDLPLIGKRVEPYITKAQTELNTYVQQTNYKDEFKAMELHLKQIEKNTTPNISTPR
jgi:hypothetical protein